MATVHQLKVTLVGTKPPVWRRVVVTSLTTLAELHGVVQAAFGWWGYHLHEFDVGGGRRACPPEDCGGVWGYERLLATLADPSDEEHASMLEWVGGSFDPGAFHPADFAERLRRDSDSGW